MLHVRGATPYASGIIGTGFVSHSSRLKRTGLILPCTRFHEYRQTDMSAVRGAAQAYIASFDQSALTPLELG